MNNNVFIELPVDSAELEDEDIKENVVKEIENDEKELPEIKSVTLDWKNEFKNKTKYNVDVEELKLEKLNFDFI